MARVVCKQPSCNRTFQREDSMLQHFRDSHSSDLLQQQVAAPKKTMIPCKHPSCCNCSFQSEDSMLQHRSEQLQVAAGSKMTLSPCKHCKSFFETAAGLEQHHAAVPLTELLSRTMLQRRSTVSADGVAGVVASPTQQQEQMEVACNDCGRTFKSTESLHQHQWDSALHTRVSRTRMTNNGPEVRECSQCSAKFKTAIALEQHFMDLHPLSMVPESDEDYTWQSMAGRFASSWKKTTVALHGIHTIFQVYNPGWRRKGFEDYRKELKREFANQQLVQLGPEEDIDVRNRVLDNGNELLRFHGTTVKCRLGVSTAEGVNGAFSSLCSDPGCSLCRILKTGFKTSKCRVKNFQRFGRGIYCSATSSKANDYVRCLEQSGPNCSSPSCKVMMVCKVLAGRLHRSTHNLQHLTCSPPGFHSVQGDPGEVLNYDELVVYDDRAILPAYIVIYTSD